MVKMGFDISESSKVDDAMKKVNDSTKKAGEGVSGFNTKGREMHELISKIGTQSPILGSALKACFSPEAAGIALFIGALELILGYVEKVQEKIKDLTVELEKLWMTEQDAMAKAQNAIEDYQRKIADIFDLKKQKLDEENKAFERQLQLISAIQTGHEKDMAAINEAADAELKRKREREDKTLTPEQRQSVAVRRELEDATIRRQREKQADADAKIAEEATRKAVANRLAKLNKDKSDLGDGAKLASDTATQNAARSLLLAAKNSNLEELKKEIAKAEDEINKASGGNVGTNILKGITPLPMQGLFTSEEEARAKKADLEKEYVEMLKGRNELQHQIEAANEKVAKNLADQKRNSDEITSLTDKQRALEQTIMQNRSQRAALGVIHDRELASLMPGTGGLTRSEMLANTLAGDVTLQGARSGLAAARSESEKRYWQQIIDQRTRFDRQRFAGVLTPEELKTVIGTDKHGNPVQEQTEYLRRLAEALAPPGGDQ